MFTNTSVTGLSISNSSYELATFGAGCFWGIEKSFRKKFKNNGLIDCQVGYAAGHDNKADYRKVCTGKTGHAEVIQVKYDPKVVSFPELVDFFYRSHDPLTVNRQGYDSGTQYRSCICYHDENQRILAEEGTKTAQKHFGSHRIATTIEPIGIYIPAESYHQDYLTNNPNGYECATHFERTWEQIRAKYL
ncbi:peptide methionine sulfoxide reductase MsrA [Globomyces pollinis-pini]|nr:peptide methionine sulfoxide reductase MsrA [Globomyces pollinis-pini]